jgi:hypothetical protein
MLVWLYVTAYIVLAGAALNGESLRGDSASATFGGEPASGTKRRPPR